MTQRYFPFDSGAGSPTYEADWRKMADKWLATGVLFGELNGLAVSANGSAMAVSVATGRAWIKGHFYESDAVEALAIDAADPSNPRIDRVVARATYSQPGVPGTVALAVLKGTPAGSPTAPALTQNTTTMWEVPLAQVRVDAAAVVIAANKVTDERSYANNVEGCHLYRSINQTISGSSVIVWDSKEFDVGRLHSTSINPSRVTVPRAGRYRVTALAGFGYISTGGYHHLRVIKNNSNTTPVTRSPGVTSNNSGYLIGQVSGVVNCAAGDYLELCIDPVASVDVVATNTWMQVERIGDAP